MEQLKLILDFILQLFKQESSEVALAVLFCLFCIYVVNKMHKLYTKEIDRVTEERNQLQNILLEGRRLSTFRIEDIIEYLEDLRERQEEEKKEEDNDEL